MNIILSKLLCGFSIVLASFQAKSQVLASNTNKNLLSPASKIVVKEANIKYPSSLQDHINESLDYVEKFSEKKRNYLIRTYQRGKKFFPKIAAVLKRYHLPQELKVLIALESAFNANAVSSAGAKGYWQFMDGAAKEYGLQIVDKQTEADPKNKKKDDRTNFSKSTLAAAKYLSDRRRNLNNDLLLIVASYNWGIGNVWNAMKKTGKSEPGFWDIKKYLPSETKAYVMNFIALNVVFANYDNFVKNQMVFISETIEIPVTDNAGKINTSITE